MKLYQKWFLMGAVNWFFGPMLYSLVDWMDGKPGFVHLYWCFAIWAWLMLVVAVVATIGGAVIFVNAKADGKAHYE